MAEMNNKKKGLNVPPLRFSEFKGEWETIRASDLLETFSTNSLTWDDLNYEGGAMKDVHYGLIHQRFDSAVMDSNSDLIPFIKPGKEPKKCTLVKEGDLILADASEDVAECGEPVEFSGNADYPMVSGLHTIHCRDKTGKTVAGFKSFLFGSLPVKQQIARLCEGTKIYSISNDTLRELWLSIPEKEEQAKIVSLLENLDERIHVQRKTIEDYRNLLDWVIGRIFNWHGLMNGEPKAKLKQLLVPSSKEGVATSLYKKATIKLHLEGMTWFDGTRQMKDTRPFYVRHAGEIIIGKQNYFNGSVAIVPKEFDGCVCSNAIMSFSISPSINQTYLFFAVANKEFLQERSYWANGTGQKELSERDFLNFEISIPPLKRQNQIGDVINKLQNKIDTEIMILEKLERGREFLLNSLFA